MIIRWLKELSSRSYFDGLDRTTTTAPGNDLASRFTSSSQWPRVGWPFFFTISWQGFNVEWIFNELSAAEVTQQFLNQLRPSPDDSGKKSPSSLPFSTVWTIQQCGQNLASTVPGLPVGQTKCPSIWANTIPFCYGHFPGIDVRYSSLCQIKCWNFKAIIRIWKL